MNLFIFKPKNEFFSGGRRKKLKRPQMKTCTDRPVKKKHKMMMITAVPGALSLRWETQQQQQQHFKKKFISVAAAPKIQQNVK